MATLEQREIFHKAHYGEHTTRSCVECIDGTGTVECCSVFPGVDLFFNYFQAYHCREYYEAGEPLQINFCIEGRFECSFSEKECCILGPGDFSVHGYEGSKRQSVITQFPLGYFRGVGIFLDHKKAAQWAGQLGIFAPDFKQIRERLLGHGWYQVRRTTEKCAHVFGELPELAKEPDMTLLRLKVIELFLLLQKQSVISEELPYFQKEQVKLVKKIKDRMVSEQNSYISLKRLAEEYGISITQLQKIFKSLYGVPVYQYLREYRMERAAVALTRTNRSVTEVALEAGFTNPGKFTESFKRRYGMTPTKYRMKNQFYIACETASRTEI